MSRDIPGFIYDEQKNRYFPIQPNHRAGVIQLPYNSKPGYYSVETVKKQYVIKDDLLKTSSWQQRQQQQTIGRSQLLSPSTKHDGAGAIVLSRRLGESKGTARGDIADWWASNLRRGRLLARNASGSSFAYSSSTNKIHTSFSLVSAMHNKESDEFAISNGSIRETEDGVHMAHFPPHYRNQPQYPEQTIHSVINREDETAMLCSMNTQQGAKLYFCPSTSKLDPRNGRSISRRHFKPWMFLLRVQARTCRLNELILSHTY